MTAVTVQKYGVHYRWPIPAVLGEQLWLVHSLREDLVTAQHEYEAGVKTLWSAYPQVAAAETVLAAAEAAAAQAAEEVMLQRSRQRSKRITGPAVDELTAARTAVTQARQDRRDATTTVRDDAADRLRGLSAGLRARHKQLYRSYVDRGLYWASFNDVYDHHRAAVKRLQQQRAQGRPAALGHHRFDGTGTITVQLQRHAGQPPRTPAVLADPAGTYRNVLVFPGWVDPPTFNGMSRAEQRRAGRVTIRLRCGSTTDTGGRRVPAFIEVPLQVHRWLPATADITSARLTVQHIAGDTRAWLTVTARLDNTAAGIDVNPGGPTVAVHLGWRDTGDSTTVATWRSTAPLRIDPDLAGVLRADPGGCTGTVALPHQIAQRLAATDTIRATRDVAVNQIREQLTDWLTRHGPIPHPTRPGAQLTAAETARWRAPARLAALALRWRTNPPEQPGAGPIAAALETWRAADRVRWQRQEHGRRKALGHRDDLYRQIAATLAGQAGTIVVDDTNLAQIARRETDLPADVERRIAHRRTIAAPGGLRAATIAACTRDHVPIITVPAAGLSRRHAACGHDNPADDRYSTHPVHCDGCGASYDQDTNATTLMLTRALTPNTNPPGTPPADPPRTATTITTVAKAAGLDAHH